MGGCLAAAELVGPRKAAEKVAAVPADDRLRGVAFPVVEEFVSGGCPEWVVDPRVQVG
jgi:hypothetical protein